MLGGVRGVRGTPRGLRTSPIKQIILQTKTLRRKGPQHYIKDILTEQPDFERHFHHTLAKIRAVLFEYLF